MVGPTILLRREKQAVNSALLMVRCSSNSASNDRFNFLITITDQPHESHLPDPPPLLLPNNEASVATWSRKPSTGMSQLLCFSGCHLRTDKWLFLQLLVIGYDVMPLCHFQSILDGFALCSHVLQSSGIAFLTSRQVGHWYNLCSSTIQKNLLHLASNLRQGHCSKS